MKIRITAAFFFFISFIGYSQKIAHIIGVKTYFYSDTTHPNLVIDPSVEYKFDQKGRLVLNGDVEGICAGEYKFDSLDRKINENWYCGEGHSEKTMTFSGDLKTTTEGTGMTETVIIDSLNKKGKPFYTSEKNILFENFGSSDPDTIYTTRIYRYNDFGNETYCMEFSGAGVSTSRKQKDYDENNKLILLKKYWENELVDSTLYQYDEKNRLTGIQRYVGNGYTDFVGFERYYSYSFKYPPTKGNAKLTSFTDSIIQKIDLFPYWQYEPDKPSVISEMQISSKSLDNDPFYTEEINYQYKYDKKGRMVALTGQGVYSGGHSVYNHAEIIYDKKKTTVKWFAKNDKGNIYNSQTDYYENYLLQKTEEFGNDGVLSSTMEYTYTFY